MKKFLNFDLQRSSYANPVLKEFAQLSLLKKIESRKLLEVSELGQRCYSIEKKDNRWLEQISDCFEHYKVELKRVGDMLKQAEFEMMQIEDEFMTKEMNCYSLVSEFEMESCIKDYKLQCLNQKQKYLIGLMNQIEYITSNAFRHNLYATLIQQYSRVHPQNQRKKSRSNSDGISKSMFRSQPIVEKPKIRCETIDVVMRSKDSIPEETYSQRLKIINQRVCVVNTFNRIINVDRVGHRLQRGQLLRHLREFYSQIIVEQINRVLKVPDTLTLQMYEQLVISLQQLDRKQYLNLCFQIYDLSGQGVITSTNLLSILSVEKNTSIIENDILTMIQLRSSLLKSQLDKSESSRLPKLRTIVINHKRTSKGKRMMISQVEDEVDQIVIHPINRLKLIDKNQFSRSGMTKSLEQFKTSSKT